MIVCLLASGVFAASTPGASPKATHAAGSPSPSAAPTASAAQLSPAEKAQAIKTDSVTIPTPGELFAALAKPGKPDWAGRYRGPIAMNYKTRAQIALNIGGLIADGFIAVEAQDTQQVKNIGGDIVKMAKALGVSESILSRGNSINQFAENDEWSTLQEELEATQNEVKASMQSHRDQDLVILVSLGGWIRGTQVVSGVVAKNYDEKLGQVLRQPELLRFIRSKIAQDLAGPAKRSAGQERQRSTRRDRADCGDALRPGAFGGGSDETERERQQIDAGHPKEGSMMRRRARYCLTILAALALSAPALAETDQEVAARAGGSGAGRGLFQRRLQAPRRTLGRHPRAGRKQDHRGQSLRRE